MSTKTNSTDNISFTYNTNVLDGEIKPFKKDKIGEHSVIYTHNESDLLSRMLDEYLNMRFSKINSDAAINIVVNLQDFWIEQYIPESAGEQFLKAMVSISIITPSGSCTTP